MKELSGTRIQQLEERLANTDEYSEDYYELRETLALLNQER